MKVACKRPRNEGDKFVQTKKCLSLSRKEILQCTLRKNNTNEFSPHVNKGNETEKLSKQKFASFEVERLNVLTSKIVTNILWLYSRRKM